MDTLFIMENLSNIEMINIQGGSLYEPASSASISFTTSTDCILNLTFERSYGTHHSITNLSAGKDINLNLGANSKI